VAWPHPVLTAPLNVCITRSGWNSVSDWSGSVSDQYDVSEFSTATRAQSTLRLASSPDRHEA
jgi:hypothetical protein